jgi:stage II sporulation protein M
MAKNKRVRKGKNWRIGAEIDSAIDYLKGSLRYIYFVSLVFLIAAIFGFLFYQEFYVFEGLLREIIFQIQGMNALEITSFILRNNSGSAFFGLIFGIAFGVFPIFSSALNGFVLGYVFRALFAVSGVSEFWKILPHGIFELPAVFIALGIGLRLGMYLFVRGKKMRFLEQLKNALLVFLFIIVPLLFVAAVIEGFLISLYK